MNAANQPRTVRRQWRRVAAVVAAGAGLALGAMVAPQPALAADPHPCLKTWHTSGITTQTVYGRNDCSWGTFGFQVYNWSSISSEWSPCVRANPGQTVGWKWTKGRPNYRVYGC